MGWFRNSYECDRCTTNWTDEWSCMCDDRCPNCNLAMSPEDSDDLTVVIEMRGSEYFIIESPDEAEDGADYKEVAGPYRTHGDAAKAMARFLAA